VNVLIIVSALLALDAGIARLGAQQGWTRPVAWLGPALGIFGSLLFSVALLPIFGASSRETAIRFDALAETMAEIGHPLDATAGPVITDFPIWLAETARIPSLALPEEPPSDVLDLARTFDARLIILLEPNDRRLSADVDAGLEGSACLRELDLGTDLSTASIDPLGLARAFEVVCP